MLDRSIAPVFNKPEIFRLPPVDKSKLSNGIPYFEISTASQPAIKFEMIFRGGNSLEPQTGLSFFTSKMLTSGTKKFSAAAIEENIALHGAFLDVTSGHDHVALTVYCLEKFLPEVLEIVHQLLNEATFPATELHNLKNIQLQNLRVNKEKTTYLATTLLRSHFYKNDHPYSKIMDEDDVKEVDKEGLIGFYPKLFDMSACSVFVSGGGRNCYEMIDRVFGRDKISVTPESLKTTMPEYNSGTFHLEKDGALQSSIRVAFPTIPQSDEEYPVLALGNEILGGYFGSRLMKNIREDKGFTYGIHSSIINLLDGSYWICGTDVRKEVKDETIGEIKKEVARLCQEPVSDDEMETVKNYMLGSFLNSLNTPFSIMEKYKSVYYHSLQDTYYEDLFREIEQADAYKLMEIYNKYFKEENFLIATAG